MQEIYFEENFVPLENASDVLLTEYVFSMNICSVDGKNVFFDSMADPRAKRLNSYAFKMYYSMVNDVQFAAACVRTRNLS